MNKRQASRGTLGLIAIAATSGCGLVLGLGDFSEGPGGVGGGSTGTGGAATSSSTGTPATCSDGAKGLNESDVDCGGICGPDLTCADGKGCVTGADCKSHVCSAGGICAVAACGDGAQNGTETDVDCGDACPKCGPGKQCKSGGDCKSASCASGQCQSTCTDGEKGGVESDVDCGGGMVSGCAPCGEQKACKAATDCESGACSVDICVKSYQWAKRYGVMSSTDLAVDGSGNSIVIGTA